MSRAKANHKDDRGNPITPQQKWDRDHQFGKTDSPRDQKRRENRTRYERDRYWSLRRSEYVSISKVARYLDVFEQTVVELLDKGVIPSVGEGRDRRVMRGDVVDYQKRWFKVREAVLDELDVEC